MLPNACMRPLSDDGRALHQPSEPLSPSTAGVVSLSSLSVRGGIADLTCCHACTWNANPPREKPYPLSHLLASGLVATCALAQGSNEPVLVLVLVLIFSTSPPPCQPSPRCLLVMFGGEFRGGGGAVSVWKRVLKTDDGASLVQ